MHSYLHLFATPPCTTNVRLTGHDITSRSYHLTRLLANNDTSDARDDVNDDAKEQESNSDSNEFSKANTCNSINTVQSQNWSISWWHDIGLPYAAIVIPRQLHNHYKRTSQWCTNNSSDGNKKTPLVCVDVGCAEAILRGSDVFAPGVMYLSQSHFIIGQAVHVVWVVESQETECCGNTEKKVESKLRTATVPHIHETILQYHQHSNRNDNCKVAVNGLPCYNITDNTSNNNAASSRYKTYIVLLAKGFAEMDSRTLSQHSQKGLAVRVVWNAFKQPSSLTLEHLFTPHNAHHGSVSLENNDHQPKEEYEQYLHRAENIHEHHTGKLFLQNYSSMVPVSLLVRRLCASQERPWKVLDACAAPGGKTSLLVSLLEEELKGRQDANIAVETAKRRYAEEEEDLGEDNNNFTVVACERSRARFATLQRTLYSHFTNEENYINKVEENVMLGDANTDLAKVNSTKEDSNDQFLQKVLRLYNVDVNKLSSSAAASVCANIDQIEEQPCNKFTGTDDEHKECKVSINSLEHERECQGAFDGILLDPPCTGMGLRPRLLPHYSTTAEKEIISAADYQRKLFDSCVRLLCKHDACSCDTSIDNNNDNAIGDCVAMKALGEAKEERHKRTNYIVYSTCTITVEENEQNVLYFLQRYPFLRLARACNEAEQYLCNKLTSTRYTQANSCAINTSEGNTHKDDMREELHTKISTKPFLLYDEIMQIQRLRECKQAEDFLWSNDKQTQCNVQNSQSVENEQQCAKAVKEDAVDVTQPVLVLRFMPRKEHNIINNYASNNNDYNANHHVREDGVGFFVAVFETICEYYK